MNKALTEHSTDIIGLARPLTAEPHFCKQILSGKSTAAKPNLVNQQMQTASSYLQIGYIIDGGEIPDLSDKEIATKVEKAIQDAGPEAWLYRAKLAT
jgi:hypothetical protein